MRIPRRPIHGERSTGGGAPPAARAGSTRRTGRRAGTALACHVAGFVFVSATAFPGVAQAVPNRYMTVHKKVVPNQGGYPHWTVGSGGTFSITVTNSTGIAGQPFLPGTYTIQEEVPAGMTVTSVNGVGSPTSWTCSPTAPVAGPATITCTFTIGYASGVAVPEVDDGQSLPPILVNVHADAPPDSSGGYTNCARAGERGPAKVRGLNPTCVTVKPFVEVDETEVCVEKYLDGNGDTVQNPLEPSVAGATFDVTDSDGAQVAELVSGRDPCARPGPGRFTVTEREREGWVPTDPPSGSRTIRLVPGQIEILSFGNRPTSQICVHKFEDLDRDGTQDPDEPLLDDWQFDVTGPMGLLHMSTDTRFSCLWVVPGSYTVTEIPQTGWVATAPVSGTQNVNVVENASTLVTFGNARRCCLRFAFRSGKRDNFSAAGPAEPANPVPGSGSQSFFDQKDPNLTFTHRIALGSGNCLASARLRIRVKALGGQSDNDFLSLEVPGGQVRNLGLTALNGSPWLSSEPPKTLSLDLDALPLSGSPSSLLASLNSVRTLDVIVSDDTAVDFATLTVRFCECDRRKR